MHYTHQQAAKHAMAMKMMPQTVKCSTSLTYSGCRLQFDSVDRLKSLGNGKFHRWVAFHPRRPGIPQHPAEHLLRQCVCRAVNSGKHDSDFDREKGREYRRVVFDGRRWEQHRSINRYVRHMSGIFSSRIVRGLLGPMLYVASICFSVCLYHTLLEYHLLQQWVAPDLEWPTINLNSSGIFSISTFALSLLLVFRTNSSYERWWEARDCWRMIVNECTHLARQAEQWLPGPASQPVRTALLRWLRVFPLCLMVHLRGEDEELPALVKGVLQPDEASLLLASSNPPLLVLSAIGQLLAVSEMRIESKTHMDESVRVLQESLGSCEKILTTPIPISYTRHTGRFLVLWLTCLPFVIWQELGWFSVPISMVVSFLLFGIEEIGVQIEEPFGILALESYCDEVQAGISQATEDAQALLPLTLKLTGGLAGDHLPACCATAVAAATAAQQPQDQQQYQQQIMLGMQLQQLQQTGVQADAAVVPTVGAAVAAAAMQNGSHHSPRLHK